MNNTDRRNELLNLFQQWANHFGYLDGKIQIASDEELQAFATTDCTLTSHPPLWGARPGLEKAVPATTVRRSLQGLLRSFKVTRLEMHVAVNETKLCLYFVVKGRLKLFPFFDVMNVPLAFVLGAVETPQGLRIDEVHEWPAASPTDALKVLVAQHAWPATARFEQHVAFGAVS
ncbi:MAG: hypothetical protein WCG80_16440 [Spirochaetales bacterium]